MVSLQYGTSKQAEKPVIITREYTFGYTVSSGSYDEVTATDLGISDVPGYIPFAIVKIRTSSSSVVPYSYQPGTSGGVVWLRNVGSASVSNTLTIIMAYIRNDVISS